MLKFDYERSIKLDEEIVDTLANLLKNQKLVKLQTEKNDFLLRERKIIYELFTKVNQERRLLREEYLVLLQKLTEVDNAASVELIKENYEKKQRMHNELYERFMDREKARNRKLIDIISDQQHEITELREAQGPNESMRTSTSRSERMRNEVAKPALRQPPVQTTYKEANVQELVAQKKENELLEKTLNSLESLKSMNSISKKAVPTKHFPIPLSNQLI